ncbi:MAG: hypothetical protein ACREJ6_05055 [Candidatus Methylomirabilis sp.]
MRLAERHVRLLRERAQREGVSVSEALRRLLDEHAPPRPVRGRPPTAKEREMVDRLFGAFGLVPSRRNPPRQR